MKDLKSYQNILSSLDKRIYKPIYCLDGHETYFLDMISDRIEHEVLTPEQRSFNLQIMYSKDVKMRDVVSAARRFPMMADHQVIILREAQDMKDLDELTEYANNPTPSTVLVIVLRGKTVPRNTLLGKALKKHAEHFTSSPMRESDMQPWLNAHLRMLGLKMDPQALQLLLDSTGINLHRIDGELKKIVANTGAARVITASDVAASTGIDRQYNVFEFSKALRQRNLYKSLDIAAVIGHDKKNAPLQLIIPVISNDFRKIMMVHEIGAANREQLIANMRINPYFLGEFVQAAGHYSKSELKRIMGVLSEFDLRSKGIGQINGSDHELLRELVVRIIH